MLQPALMPLVCQVIPAVSISYVVYESSKRRYTTLRLQHYPIADDATQARCMIGYRMLSFCFRTAYVAFIDYVMVCRRILLDESVITGQALWPVLLVKSKVDAPGVCYGRIFGLPALRRGVGVDWSRCAHMLQVVMAAGSGVDPFLR